MRKSPSPALCPSIATLCGAGAVTPRVLAPLFTPAPRKWRCLGLRLYLPGAWVARGEAALAAPWHRFSPCCGCHPAGRGSDVAPRDEGLAVGAPRLCPALGCGGGCVPLPGLGPCGAAEPSFYGGDSLEHGPGSQPRGVSGDTAIVPAPAQGGFLRGGIGLLREPPPCPKSLELCAAGAWSLEAEVTRLGTPAQQVVGWRGGVPSLRVAQGGPWPRVAEGKVPV